MYNYESIEQSYDKFMSYIRKEIILTELKIEDINSKISNIVFVIKCGQDLNAKKILDNKSTILKIYPELEMNINILEFFSQNNALQTEQAIEQLVKIKDFFEKTNNNREDLFLLNNQLDILNTKLSKLNNVLKYGITSKNSESLIDSSNLTDKEKLDIYTKLALDSISKNNVKETTTIKKSYEELIDKYNKQKQKVNAILKNYYYLIEKKDPNYLKYAKELMEYNKANNVDKSDYNYTEEELIIELLELIDTRDIIEEIIKNNGDIEDLDINTEILEESIKKIDTLSNNYEMEKEEKDSPSPSNIFILLDNSLPVFDIDNLEKTNKLKVKSLLEKLEKGIHDYTKGLKHTKLQTGNYKDYPVFINKSSDIACAYIRIDSSRVLLLNIDNNLDIFDSTNQILNKYSTNIKLQIEKILNNDMTLISDMNYNLVKLYNSINDSMRLK